MSYQRRFHKKRSQPKRKSNNVVISGGGQQHSDRRHAGYILNLQRTLGNQAVVQMMRDQGTDRLSQNNTFPKMVSSIDTGDSSSQTVQRDTGSTMKEAIKLLKRHGRVISELKEAIIQNNIEQAMLKLDYLRNRKYLFKDLKVGSSIFGALLSSNQKMKSIKGIRLMASNRKKFKAVVKKYENVPGAGYEIAYSVRMLKAGKEIGGALTPRLRQQATEDAS